MEIEASPGCCSESEHSFRHSEIEWCGHFDVGRACVQHLHRPTETFEKRRIIGDGPLLCLRLCMATSQLINLKPLGRLGSPQLGSLGSSFDQAVSIDLFNRVCDRCCCDQGIPVGHDVSTAIE